MNTLVRFKAQGEFEVIYLRKTIPHADLTRSSEGGSQVQIALFNYLKKENFGLVTALHVM